MPSEKSVLGTAQEWLKRAKGNLARAKQPKPREAFWDDLCFDAQQAAEKSIKAVLVLRQIEFPRTHNVRALLELLDRTGPRSQRKSGMQLS
jgi:HEPN domain-containing protein